MYRQKTFQLLFNTNRYDNNIHIVYTLIVDIELSNSFLPALYLYVKRLPGVKRFRRRVTKLQCLNPRETFLAKYYTRRKTQKLEETTIRSNPPPSKVSKQRNIDSES